MFGDRMTGTDMYALAERLYPLPRSMTGEGNRETLRILQEHVPLTMHEVPSGTQVFDWVVPPEWEGTGDIIIGADGRGDSYANRWHDDGSLTYGSLLLPGRTSKEIFLSCYICHPMQAQDGLSGIVLAVALVKWWQQQERRHALRVAFVPETLGALCYMAASSPIKVELVTSAVREWFGDTQHLDIMKRRVVAGFVLTCCGMETRYTLQRSRNGDTLADRVAWRALNDDDSMGWMLRHWEDRGSDERQYCAPGVDLPVVCIMRGAHHSPEFPQYHATSPNQGKDDTMDIISPAGLQGSLDVHVRCLEILEANAIYQVTTIGEPQLGKRGLYTKDAKQQCGMSDGKTDLLAIAERIGRPMLELVPTAHALEQAGLLRRVE